MVVHACNPNTQEAKAGRFEASLGYTWRSCLKKLGLQVYLSGRTLAQHVQGPAFHRQHQPPQNTLYVYMCTYTYTNVHIYTYMHYTYIYINILAYIYILIEQNYTEIHIAELLLIFNNLPFLVFCLFHFYFLRQGFTIYPKLISNSLCGPAGFKLVILLPQLLKYWDYRYKPPHLAVTYLFNGQYYWDDFHDDITFH
jgi:hypothetical protein